MSLKDRLADDFKQALKSGEKDRVSVLRMIKSAVQNREIEKGGALDDEEIRSVLNSYVKRARESIEQFTRGGREDLAAKEKRELDIIQQYLPEQLSEDDVKKIVSEAVSGTGAEGPRDMGKVMKAVMARVKGQADGKLVNKLVKEMLEAK